MDKERRLIRFLLASSLVMLAFLQIQGLRNPPPEEDQIANVEGQDGEGDVDGDGQPDGGEDGEGIADPDGAPADNAATENGEDADPAAAAGDIEPTGEIAEQSHVIGSLDPTSPYQLAVYFTNRGAAIERIDLNSPRYQDLDDKSGYLGSLGLKDDPKGGCRVSHVAPGSPAAAAGFSIGQIGESNGDRIIKIGDTEIADQMDVRNTLAKTKPGDNIKIEVMRGGNKTNLTATLVKRPLSLISPEPSEPTEEDPRHPLSFLMTLGKVGTAKVGVGKDEIKGLPKLRDVNWKMTPLEANGSLGEGVEFTRRLTKEELAKVGGKVPLELVKRYRLTKVDRSEEATKADEHGSNGYLIDFEMEIRNLGASQQILAYQLDGPTGLPLEGWWYSYKVHPKKWSGAGARDVVWEDPDSQTHKMYTGSMIAGFFKENGENSEYRLFESRPPTRLNYVGVDAQYFTVALKPSQVAEGQEANSNQFSKAAARLVGPVDKKKRKRTDVSFRVTGKDVTVAPGQTYKENFTIFAGPKQPKVLEQFGLEKCIVYGWFGAIAKPMIGILHFFHDKVRLSWGLSIVALTVLVRMLMFPIGRKMAMNAQKMQELAPEMKKITDKYKDNLEKRGAAMQELYRKHNYNPAAGCLMMPLQMPIFVGLYRGLSVDIGLRQAPFFEGMSWCSNLAGPDKFWHWEHVVPTFLGSPEGFLGPFLNVLPFVTVVLFLLQQILFTPPPQDENQAMQQQIMKFMMIFMGVMFHKVAAGLCIYMIASSLWGIGERMLLPKKNVPAKDAAESAKPAFATGGARSGSNGSSNGTASRKKKKKKRKK